MSNKIFLKNFGQFDHKLHLCIILAPLALSLLIILAIVTILKFLPPRLPLFYSLPWGENQLATHQQFIVIPASISAVALLNLIISWQLHPSQSFFKKVLLIASLIVGLIMIITFIKIILNFV